MLEREKKLAGKRIKLVRKMLAMNQEGLADALNTDARTVRRWEAGQLSDYGLERIAVLVNVPAYYFLMPEPDDEFKQQLFAGLKAKDQKPLTVPAKPPASLDTGGLRQINKIAYMIKARTEEDATPPTTYLLFQGLGHVLFAQRRPSGFGFQRCLLLGTLAGGAVQTLPARRFSFL